jgi:hypothetical protein
MTTPNMGLTLPVPGVTAGPAYASQEVAALNLVDAHDHSSGRGVLIPTAALNVNADLAINSYSLNTVGGLRLVNLTATPVTALDVRIVYSKNGELAYRDAAGNEVLITAAGSIAGATGTITGLTSPASATFSSISGAFTFSKDSSKPGKLAISDINLYEFNNATANGITLKSPASLASAYTLTLPAAIPTQSNVLVSDGTGVLSFGWSNGLVATPGTSFASELGLGLYRSAAKTLSVASNGVEALRVDDAKAMVQSGTAAAPSLSFMADTTTGLYRAAAGKLAVSIVGVQKAAFVSTGLQLVDGAVATPAFTFLSDTATGFYRTGVGASAYSSNGTKSVAFTLGGMSANSLYDLTGNSGIDLNSTQVRTSAQGAGMTFDGTSLNFDSGTGVQFASGGVVKMKTFTGSLVASGSVTLSVPSGIILGAVGYSSYDGSSTWQIMPYTLSGGSVSSCSFFISTSTSTLLGVVNNDTNSTNSYRVVMFYV